MNTFAVETDTKLAEAHGRLATASQKRSWAADTLRRNAGQKQTRGHNWMNWSGTLPEAVTFHLHTDKTWYQRDFEDYKTAVQNHADISVEVEMLNNLYTGWSRFFLVTNTNGHVHSTMNCSTCFNTTTFAWLPQLSGLTETEAVADQGEILCSVCFPSAPVAWTTGVAKATQEAREARNVKSAALAAKKAEKALGTVLRVGSSDRIETIAAAKMWLTDAAQWNAWTQNPLGYHPSYTPADVALVALTLAERIGSTPEAEIAAATTRAAKRK